MPSVLEKIVKAAKFVQSIPKNISQQFFQDITSLPAALKSNVNSMSSSPIRSRLQDISSLLSGASNINPLLGGMGVNKAYNRPAYDTTLPSNQREGVLQKAAQYIYGTALTAPAGIASTGLKGFAKQNLYGSLFGGGSQVLSNLIDKKPITENVGRSAVGGAENSYLFPLSSAATERALQFLGRFAPSVLKLSNPQLTKSFDTIGKLIADKTGFTKEAAKQVGTSIAKNAMREATETPTDTLLTSLLGIQANETDKGLVDEYKAEFFPNLGGNLIAGSLFGGGKAVGAVKGGKNAIKVGNVPEPVENANSVKYPEGKIPSVDSTVRPTSIEPSKRFEKTPTLLKDILANRKVDTKFDSQSSYEADLLANKYGFTPEFVKQKQSEGYDFRKIQRAMAMATDPEIKTPIRNPEAFVSSALRTNNFTEPAKKIDYTRTEPDQAKPVNIKVEPSKIKIVESTPKEIETSGTVKELGDFVEDGGELIKYNGKNVGWVQVNDNGVLEAIEIKPEFQGVGIGKTVLKEMFGDKPFKAFNLTPSGKVLMESIGKVEVDNDGLATITPNVEPKTTESILKNKRYATTKLEVEKKRQAGFKQIEMMYNKLNEKGYTDEDIRLGLQGKSEVKDPQFAELRKSIDLMGKMAGIPGDIKKENYFPEMSVDRQTTVNDETYGGRLASKLYDFSKKRMGLIPEEKQVKTRGAIKQYWDWTLSKAYGEIAQTEKLLQTHNLPETRADEVLDYVKSENKKVEELDKKLSEGKFNKTKYDYFEERRKSDLALSKITGEPINRPVLKQQNKGVAGIIDSIVDYIRIDDTLFHQRTNPEIAKAFEVLRDSRLPESRITQGKALQDLIDVVTKYDFEDKNVEKMLNTFIDNELKSGKVKQQLYSRALRVATNIFSSAHIGGNIKTIATQPTELFRIASQLGFKNFKSGVPVAIKEQSRIRKSYGLDDATAQLLALNPEYKDLNKRSLVEKGSEKLANLTLSGMKWTEEVKNIFTAATAEQAGLKKGFQIGSKEMTHFVRSEIFRLGHIGAKYSTPYIVKGGGFKSALAQYSQYALKNAVLKYDTARDPDSTTMKKLGRLTSQVLSDVAATATMALVTGIPIKTVYELFKNTALPSGFGPIVTVPKEFIDEVIAYNQETKDAKPGVQVESLESRWGETAKRNFAPTGNQIMKTTSAKEVLDKGYGESKKGNINYVTGDISPLKKTQALLFGTGAIPGKIESDKMWVQKNSGKSEIYPTLTGDQSKLLKQLPKDQQKTFYDSQISAQKAKSDLPNLIKSLLGNKKVDKETLTTLQTKPKTIADKKKVFAEIKKLTENGVDDATAQGIAKNLGIAEADFQYVQMANMEEDQLYPELIKGLDNTKNRIQYLAGLRRKVADKQVLTSTVIDYLYDNDKISKDEKKLLNAIKFDESKQKFYIDRDYEFGDSNSVTNALTMLSKTNALIKSYTAPYNVKRSKTNLSTILGKNDTSKGYNDLAEVLRKKRRKALFE